MAIIANDGTFNRQRLATEIETLKALVRDLERLLNGEDPHQSELADAPLINNWDFDRRDAVCLVGTFLDHPRLGRMVPNGITSELWYINPDAGYARTFSRFYRLGKPARFRNGNR
ncbi:hypothetical protein DKP76_16620 [Falsochrobactrum shanghaiense]|uniref:Uncharacterized protein n=1 Tax=Falsochrobactrum shanghaiense TaxID=2201899 RepID=A0A316J4I8_9HYPH|nr:DUF6634 family protein [Falsochrobactrum shanghaiense]PWL16594.1 hypothetical protein DKP76_16620 [Falsochrobactrum shanghaiense]